jgi:uncharacterized membrane protein
VARETGTIMNNWKYILNGQTFGPVELTTLQSFIDNGTLSRETLVQREGSSEWVPAHSVPDLNFQEKAQPGTVPPLSQIPPQTGEGGVPEAEDIEKNKVFAILAYLGILFIVPLLAAPNSKFARYHANQGLVLFLATVILSVGSFVLAMIPIIGCVMAIAPLMIGVGAVVLMVLGIVNAAGGQYKPLPLIGHFQILK